MNTAPALKPHIPKKKRWLITVNEALYEYCVSGNWESTRVYVRSLVTGYETRLWTEYVFPVSPGLVRDLILDAEATAKAVGGGYSCTTTSSTKNLEQ